MSNSGFRGRGFGLRGARSNGPTNGFNGPRFLHPGFNHPRPPHRLPVPEKWTERPNFMPWQQNKNFLPPPQYRGNLQFRPNSRGRVAGGHGIIRYSGPGRPPAPQYCGGFARNPVPRPPLVQEEQVEDKSIVAPHTPLLGSEEERQQKITETADKLKQKLSSITEEELTNFWEDDLSILPNSGLIEENTQNKGIPELRHEPPELDLTFTDFKDIGRVDCNNSRLDDNNDEISITFEETLADKIINVDNEIIIIDENKEESLNTINSEQDTDVFNQPNILENNEYHEQILHDLPDPECNIEHLNLQCNNVIGDLIFSDSNNTNEKPSTSDFQENLTNATSRELVNESSELDNVETTCVSETTLNGQDALQSDLSENQNLVETDANTNGNAETDLVQDDQIQNEVQTDTSQEETCQSTVNISDSSENKSFNIPPPNEEIHSNIGCDSKSSPCPTYGEVNKLNDDKKLNNPPVFQSRVYNIPTRFTPRIQGSRCRWPYQQNGKNLFPHGPQRLPFHGNRMMPPRHVSPFKSNDLVPVVFDPRAPPPFASNVPASSHDSQHNVLVPFPPAFDPSEPPPNIRPKAVIEPSNAQPHPFDPRGPPPRIPNITNEKLPEFNPQQPPPKVHKRDETLQPPPIFDPRLSSRERSNLITLDTSRSNMMTVNLMETSPVADFNFPQIPPINISPHPPYISNMQTNFQPILQQAGSGQVMMREFALPPPPINIANVPLPLPKESLEQNSNSSQGINMDDGLEDMQEAMEFAKQIMNMTEEVETENIPSKLPLTPSEIPIPNEDMSHSSSVDEACTNTLKKQKRKESRSKRHKQSTVCAPVSSNEKQEDIDTIAEEQNRVKSIEETSLTHDQIRPKVVFNLNSKTKKIHKSEEWHRNPVSNHETKETSQQGTTHNYDKERTKSKKYFSENKRNNTNQNKNQQKENNAKTNSTRCIQDTNISVYEQLTLSHENHTKSLEKSHSHSSNAVVANNINIQKNQKSRKESRKVEAPTSESTWKSRVINRFLKMSKNDICNMVNNSSLRKFDIAMKHLVKEKRPSLSLEMRNTEDEKMKEYDREEFMNQLNAMLDPGAVVGITDLPTEFIHHLSEVLQLDPMPFDLELSETQSADDKTQGTDQTDASSLNVAKCSNKEVKTQSFVEFSKHQNVCTKPSEDNSLYNEEGFSDFSLSQENISSSKRMLLNRSNPEVESTYKKQQQQQPLFNEADLDDILSEVTDKSKYITKQSVTLEPEKSIEMCKSSSLMRTVIEPLKCNAFLQIPNRTAADLDDIFSAGIARVRSTNSDNSRTRKSNSEDRSTFRAGRYERWNRKERDDPDTFRNLTKEEWEAKYGSINVAAGLAVARKCASNSAENLRTEETRSKENRNYAERYCSSDSPMRHLSLSPLTHEVPVDRSDTRMDEFEGLQRTEESESSSSSSNTSSSTDSDEESVAPDVTKLLKVIKEKEKIAKKKSLNETIRDEVTAEIEKKWKEKNKYKERKSRKREKRKRDRKEKRKKEKKKRRNRNSHSDSSKSSEEFRLLTENEIKKEVIIKEEPVSTSQDNVSPNDEINHFAVIPALANKPSDLVSRIEPPQNLQVEKQQISRVTCDITSSQIRNKPTVVSITVQPKTKAQLKQMPEFSDVQEKQIIEKTIAVTKNNIISMDSKRMKDQTEKNKHNEAAENNNERLTISPINNSFHQINVSVNITEPPSFIQSQIKTTNNNDGTSTKLFTCGTSEPVAEVNVSNQSVEQKIITTTSMAESKTGYKKIDIKAYKERTLQRRLKEQAMTKENSENSTSFSKNLYPVIPIDTTNAEPVNTAKAVKAIEMDTSKGQSKDPRLTKIRSVSTSPCENSNQEAKEKTDSEGKCQNVDNFHKNKESSVPVQSKGVGEPDPVKVHKTDLKSPSQDTTAVNKKLKTLLSAVESNRFKNIRSEGSKELKLKKEKMKKYIEKKKQLSTIEKRVDIKMIEDAQEASIVNISSTNQIKVEKVNNSETSESPITHSETSSNEIISNKPKYNRRNSATEEVNEQFTHLTDEKVLGQSIADQGTVEIQSCQSSLNLKNEENSIKKMEENIINTTEVSVTTAESGATPSREASLISIIKEEYVTDAIPPLDIVNKESHSSDEHTDVSIKKDSGKNESLTTDPTEDDKSLDAQDVEAINENDDANLKVQTSDLEAQDNSGSVLQLQDVQASSNDGKKEGTESLDSPKSPFKGFVAESIKEDIHEILKTNNESGKVDIREYPEQLLEPCLNDKSDSTNSDDESSRKQKEDSDTLLVCNLIEKAQSFAESDISDRVIYDNSSVTDNIEIGTKTLETEDSNIMQEQSETNDTIIKQKNTSPMINMHSQDTFNDDSEPFIVLDEYVDDEKSMEKISALDLDLEDCIARDAHVFISKHPKTEKCLTNNITSSNFNSIDFKDLSEVLDKSDTEENQNHENSMEVKEKSLFDRGIESTNAVSSVSEKNTELNLETSQHSKSADSTVPAIPAKSSQNIEADTLHVNRIPLHDSVISVTPKLLKTIENVHTVDASEGNSQHNSDCFSTTRSATASVESEASLKLNVPAKPAIRRSLENLSIVGTSLSEANVEFLKLNKQANNTKSKNKQELNNSFVDKLISPAPSERRSSVDKDTSFNSTVKEGTSKNSNKRALSKSNQKERDEALHKVKDKSKMKREKRKKHDISEKMIKEAVNSNMVEVKHPNTKEDILARMIEIDVEIHKLMTEKMTLYQMLTNDTLPTENNLQQHNAVNETKEAETPVLRPRTPGLLMSQLIQNLETNPVTNQYTKRSTETTHTKDNTVNSVQSNVSKTHKQEHHAEKKGNCTSTCDSDEEKMTNSGGSRSSTSRKRKKYKSERTAKKLENKSDSNVSASDSQGATAEKKQANEVKLTSKRTEHDSRQVSINEIKEDSNEVSVQQINKEDSVTDDKAETVDNEVNEKTVESIKPKTFTNNVVQSINEENCLVKNNENIIETSDEKDTSSNSVIKSLESKTSERSSIYSDDSTWDTLVQNPSAQNQKKLNTGLALLEETYKKEMAKTRKTRVETRKKRKRKVQNIPQIVKSLTPEEEELPLSTLCAKKLHKRKKLFSSRDQEEANDDQQLWKNVVEVINAVAENRTEQLYMEQPERQSGDDTEDIVPEVADLEKDSNSKLLEGSEKQTVFSSASKNTQETYSESSETLCKSTDNTNNDLNKENLQLTSFPDKSQAYVHHEEPIQENLEVGETSKTTSNLSKTPVRNNTSVSIENNMVESSAQRTVENDSVEISRLPLIEDSDTGIKSNTNNILDVPSADLHEEKVDKELNLQEKDVDITKKIVSEEHSDTLQTVTVSQNAENNENLVVESTNEIPCISNKDCNLIVNKNNDSVIQHKKDDVNNTSEELNYTSQDESFISLKEQRGIQKRKVSNEENNNKNCSTEPLTTEETSSKKSKRKRGNKTPVRRSSRYMEEVTKRIKLETDVNSQDIEQEPQNKNEQITLSSVSHALLPEKEVEHTSTHFNAKKSRSQRSQFNRRRYRAGPPAVETLPNQLTSNNEPAKEIKKHKQYTMVEMMNCEVRLIDCKHTILNPDVSSEVLQKYGISAINPCTYLDSTQVDSATSGTQSTPTKDAPSMCTKRKSSTSECLESQPSKLNRLEDTTQPSSDQISFFNVENDKEEYTTSDIDVMPVLAKEPVVVYAPQNCEKPDIEIVEEKKATTTNQQYNNSESTLTVIDTKVDKELPRTQYTVHKGPILDIKVFGNSFLAASEDGRIYRYNKASNGILNIYKGHKAAVTCLYVYNTGSVDISKEWMFSGSLDGTLRCYDITTGAQIRDTADIGSPIQCMDEAWGIIFIGTKSGHVSRYHMKSGVIKGASIQFSDKSVLALKATNEGPRKVLIVASRSQPITIRDAQNGLFLRTICGQKSYTVYSLMRDNNLIYCGTSSTSIPVFDFTNGEQILQYEAGVGIVCMRLYKQLLFAGCYDGNIYVFNTKDRQLVCSIPGPGNMLLSMEVVDNKIIAGSKDKRLQSWQMPLQVRTLL